MLCNMGYEDFSKRILKVSRPCCTGETLRNEWIFVAEDHNNEYKFAWGCKHKLKNVYYYSNIYTKKLIQVGKKCREHLGLPKPSKKQRKTIKNLLSHFGIPGEYIEISIEDWLKKCLEHYVERFDNIESMHLNELYKLKEELDILNYPNLDDLKIRLEKVIQEKEAEKQLRAEEEKRRIAAEEYMKNMKKTDDEKMRLFLSKCKDEKDREFMKQMRKSREKHWYNWDKENKKKKKCNPPMDRENILFYFKR